MLAIEPRRTRPRRGSKGRREILYASRLPLLPAVVVEINNQSARRVVV